MKKILYLCSVMVIFANCCYARVTSAKNPDFSFDFTIQSNLNYQSLVPASATVAYSIGYDGKTEDIKFLRSGGEDFDLAVQQVFNNLGYLENGTVNSALKTKKYIGDEITRSIVNLYEKNAISKGDIDRMVINRKNFFVTDITDANNVIYNTNSVNINNDELKKYIKAIDKEADVINRELNPWNSFKTKTIHAYVKINQDGKVDDAIILQSCGSEEYDSYYIDKIKNHTFEVPDKSIALKDLNFIFTAKPLKQEKYDALNKYRRSVERLIYYETPFSMSFKPTTVALEVTVSKAGKLKNIKLLESTSSKSYDKKLMEAYKKLVFKPLPGEIDLDYITFIVRIRKNAQYYPQIDDRNYTSWAILD